MDSVQFITCEDEGIDQILSFALEYGEMDIRSLILLRTPKYEASVDEAERGVSVSLGVGAGDDVDMLETVRIDRAYPVNAHTHNM